MKVVVTFTVDVGFQEGDTIAARQVEQAVAQAVDNALWAAHDNGFDHDLCDRITLLMDNGVAAKAVE